MLMGPGKVLEFFWLEGQLEVVGLELMAEGIMAGTHSKRWTERVPYFRSCNTETAPEGQTR